MKKIIITTRCLPDEPWAEVLAISEPRFSEYAERHGYDFSPVWYGGLNVRFNHVFHHPEAFIEGVINYDLRKDFILWNRDRTMLAPNWLRYAWTIQLLETYDLVVYADADLLLVDLRDDIAEGFPGDRWIANSVPQNENGGGPSGCLYMTRKCPESISFWWKVWLGQLWKVHPMWTDGVDYMDLLGYSVLPPVRKVRSSEYDKVWWNFGECWATYWKEEKIEGVKAYHIAGGNGNPSGKAAKMREILKVCG